MTPLSTGGRLLWKTPETGAVGRRISLVQKIIRAFSMVIAIVVAALAILALVTQAGVWLTQRAHPAPGRMIEVAGATLHVVDIGPRDPASLPIVMLHGASSNLEV